MILQLLANTPRWVFGLFILLLGLGLRQLATTRMALRRTIVMPFAMVGLSVYGIGSSFHDSIPGFTAWTIAAAATVAIAMRLPLQRGAFYDAARCDFVLPGSPVPLALMMGIFMTKYAVGVSLALHPALAASVPLETGIGALYGMFNGVLAARALCLWQIVWRGNADHSRYSTPPMGDGSTMTARPP
jgi:uncharacterized protein DUF6622